jgi:transcriptional regulator with XRE-family HTH domain
MLQRMPSRVRPVFEAVRLGRWVLMEIGRELRLARITAGLTQADVARAVGVSASRISRVEHGLVLTLRIIELYRHAAAVGLKPWLRLFPLGRHVLDQPQLRLIERLRARVASVWRWELEVPVPIEGDLRAADVRLSIPGCQVIVEAYTRFADAQAQIRSAQGKARDLGADRMVLLIADTDANRRALRDAGQVVREAFPLDTKAVLKALAAGTDPGQNGIIIL